MSNSDRPSFYIATPIETPLDLTVKRTNMDDNCIHSYEYSRIPGRSNSLPSQAEFQYYEQYHHTSTYGSNDQYRGNGYQTPPPQTSCYVGLAQSPPQPVSHVTSPSPSAGSYSGAEYYERPMVSNSPTFNSCILPKKRKNLWRPYDSKAALGVCNADMERDSDSSSDSASGSSSDQEFKTPSPPTDPVKKRKMNMLLYAAEEAKQNAEREMATFPSPTAVHATSQVEPNPHVTARPKDHQCGTNHVSSSSELSGGGYVRPMAEELTKSQLSLLTNYPDTREKMISGMKKRDIFGWSLKLMTPSVALDNSDQKCKGSSPSDRDRVTDNRVCQDGEKTYIELQTVKKSNSAEPSTQDIIEIPKVEQSPNKSSIPQNKPSAASSIKRQTSSKNTNNKITAEESETEQVAENGVGTKVYIQTRDNVIESYDETQNVPRNETKKGLSLIDLIEEIEADVIAKDKREIEKTNSRNKSIAVLLEQCNHVKLQALDFLMENILIQDREPHYKQKNETVQKMLKGDKICSVNMLDIVELQVEIGLN